MKEIVRRPTALDGELTCVMGTQTFSNTRPCLRANDNEMMDTLLHESTKQDVGTPPTDPMITGNSLVGRPASLKD